MGKEETNILSLKEAWTDGQCGGKKSITQAECSNKT